uniref:WASH1 WAHD domain-containing protein n=1 Tax=Panagrolaimus sp. JU765 TaxID=591449 RepID=A0AC34RNV5_9BILA
MKKITDPAPESLMFKPVLIPPDATGEEADVCFTSSLVELYKASESIFEKLENRLNKCQERAENVYRRIGTINRKVQSLGTVENAKLTYPARYPDLRKSLLTAVFEKNDFDSYVQKPEDKVIFKEDPVSAQTLKEAVIRKKDFGYAFGSGKHLEILKSLKLDDSDAEGCDLIDEDYIYAEKGKRYFESEKYDLETDSLLIYDSVGKAFQGDPFAYKPELGDPFAYKPELGALSVFDFPAVLPKLSGVKKPDLSDDWSLQSIAPSAQVSNTSGTEPQVDLSIPNNIYRRQKLPNQSVKQPESTAKAPEMDLPETISVSSSTPSLPSASLSTPNIPPKTPPSMPVKAPSPPPSFSSQMPQPTVATVSAAPPPPPPPPPPPIILPSLPELPKGRSDLM